MRDNTKLGLGLSVIAAWVIGGLAINIGIIWVIVHFIRKFW